LKESKIKLDLLSDVDMYNFIDSGIRGGNSMITHRFTERTNRVQGPITEDGEKPILFNSAGSVDPLGNTDTLIRYFDANALYSCAMSKSLPYGEFKWEDNVTEFTSEFIMDEDWEETE